MRFLFDQPLAEMSGFVIFLMLVELAVSIGWLVLAIKAIAILTRLADRYCSNDRPTQIAEEVRRTLTQQNTTAHTPAITASKYASTIGESENNVIESIRSGNLQGFTENGIWYVNFAANPA